MSTSRLVDTVDALSGNVDIPVVPSTGVEETVELPPKFKGKTVQEIIQSYSELEKAYGKQGNEYGELRRLTDQLILQSHKPSEPSTSNEPAITEEAFVEKPLETVRRIVEEAVRPLKEATAETRKMTAMDRLEKAHPDMREIVADEKFQEWVLSSPVRQELWGHASNGNLDYANEIFDLYKQTHPKVEHTQPTISREDPSLTDALAISGKGSVAQTPGRNSKPVLRRAELIRLQLEDPQRYEMLAKEIYEAYQEGRVI